MRSSKRRLPNATLEQLSAVHRLRILLPDSDSSPRSTMLKLRVVLSFAVAALLTLTSLDGVTAQLVDEPSYSGSGDTNDAGLPDDTPTTTSPSIAPKSQHAPTPTPTKDSSSSGSRGTSEASAGDGAVRRLGRCGPGDICVPGTYCKRFGNGMSICYPA